MNRTRSFAPSLCLDTTINVYQGSNSWKVPIPKLRLIPKSCLEDKPFGLSRVSPEYLAKYLERMFPNHSSKDRVMAWRYYGDWHVDHIRPICCFENLGSVEVQCRCFHYTNLQPLWASQNISKRKNEPTWSVPVEFFDDFPEPPPLASDGKEIREFLLNNYEAKDDARISFQELYSNYRRYLVEYHGDVELCSQKVFGSFILRTLPCRRLKIVGRIFYGLAKKPYPSLQ